MRKDYNSSQQEKILRETRVVKNFTERSESNFGKTGQSSESVFSPQREPQTNESTPHEKPTTYESIEEKSGAYENALQQFFSGNGSQKPENLPEKLKEIPEKELSGIENTAKKTNDKLKDENGGLEKKIANLDERAAKVLEPASFHEETNNYPQQDGDGNSKVTDNEQKVQVLGNELPEKPKGQEEPGKKVIIEADVGQGNVPFLGSKYNETAVDRGNILPAITRLQTNATVNGHPDATIFVDGDPVQETV